MLTLSQRKITTILFDCDNTLVQSEQIGSEVSAEIVNKILASRHLDAPRFTGTQMQREFVGFTFQAMMQAIEVKHNLSLNLTATELETYTNMEDSLVIANVSKPGNLLPCVGVNGVLAHLASDKVHRLAVVSSSSMARIAASLAASHQASFFAAADIFSVVSSLPEPKSKPDPAIYLHAVSQLGVEAEECIAVEDSRSGALAAIKSGITTIGYTGAYELEEQEAQRELLREAGCKLVMSEWSEFDAYLEKIEKDDGVDL
ncbi:hypothetical protein PT974_03179 [Cladobotryum mycophilum]|uniref:Uncharacterized protein n=1 Tax=Cladobotryum mycophilum TaxID=491253 RepID=A0ABR0SRK1_9HYPO